MNCREFVEFLMDYLDGLPSEPERRTFEDHLAECPDCVAYLETYQEAIRIGKEAYSAGEDPIAPDVPENLVRAVLAARKTVAWTRHDPN
jgi:anti-sigma factor RsiW